jgi:hypothetical protein
LKHLMDISKKSWIVFGSSRIRDKFSFLSMPTQLN